MKTNTLRFRISIFYVAVIGLVLFLFQGILYLHYVKSVSNEFDVQLINKAEQIGGAVNTFKGRLGKRKRALNLAAQNALNLTIEYPNYIFMPESPEKFWLAEARRLRLERDYIVIMDNQGKVIGTSKNVTRSLLFLFKKIGLVSGNKNVFYKTKVDDRVLRIVRMPYFYTYKQGYTIVVATSYRAVERMLWQHLLFMLATTFVFLVIASLVVRLFVVSVLTSVMEISNAARSLTQENLNARIKLTHADEEIGHLTESLNEMIARLEKSFNHIKEFSMEVAHEVKTPLAIISGEAQMALKKDCTVKEYKDVLETVLKEARKTQDFVTDLLLLTKLDYRLIEMRFEPMDLAQFLRDICQELRIISIAKGVDIQQDILQGPVVIKGDKIHLERVFINLIDNALNYARPGGFIKVDLKCSRQKAIVLISDNGIGISTEDLPRVFNKFYRGLKNDGKGMAGCGLGLSIVYSIVKVHQGEIVVDSQLNKGTTFRIEFPVVE